MTPCWFPPRCIESFAWRTTPTRQRALLVQSSEAGASLSPWQRRDLLDWLRRALADRNARRAHLDYLKSHLLPFCHEEGPTDIVADAVMRGDLADLDDRALCRLATGQARRGQTAIGIRAATTGDCRRRRVVEEATRMARSLLLGPSIGHAFWCWRGVSPATSRQRSTSTGCEESKPMIKIRKMHPIFVVGSLRSQQHRPPSGVPAETGRGWHVRPSRRLSMNQGPRWCGALVALAMLTTTAAARAPQDDTKMPASRDLDAKLHSTLKDVINHGAELYNSGEMTACYRLFEGSLMTIKPLLDHRPGLQRRPLPPASPAPAAIRSSGVAPSLSATSSTRFAPKSTPRRPSRRNCRPPNPMRRTRTIQRPRQRRRRPERTKKTRARRTKRIKKRQRRKATKKRIRRRQRKTRRTRTIRIRTKTTRTRPFPHPRPRRSPSIKTIDRVSCALGAVVFSLRGSAFEVRR